jgi:hypothetical protein
MKIKKILIIEDSEMIIDWHKRIASGITECEFIIYQHIEPLQEYLASSDEEYDCAMVDGSIFGGHTREILHLLDHTKTIIISAELEYAAEAKECGCRVEMKPIMSARVESMIKEILGVVQ